MSERPEPNVHLSDRTMTLIEDWHGWSWQETSVDDVVFMAMSFMDMASMRKKFWTAYCDEHGVRVSPKAGRRSIAAVR